jgi:hypothetical protein
MIKSQFFKGERLMFNQKEGVYNAVTTLIGYAHTESDEGLSLATDQKKLVKAAVAEGLFNGEIQISDAARQKYNTMELMQGYANGLVDNWLRKDKRFNEGSVYQTKNPGSRAGSGDSLLRELKKLAQVATSDEDRATVQAAIETRQAEVAAEKTKKIEIDLSIIPEELRHLIPQVG